MKVFYLLIFTFLFINVYSQTNLSGIVLDEKEGSPLFGVSVLIKELKIGTSTNDKGEFLIKNLKQGSYTLVFSLIGHRNQIIKINFPEENFLTIKLIDGNVDLDEIVVTGNPFSLDKKEIAQSSIVVSNQNLIINRSSTVAEILNFQPGVSIRSNGTATSRPVIRGFSNNRILILDNGLRIGDLSNSSDDHAVAFDGGNAEKIEVLRGPSSLLYGSNAIGGVVNIISEDIPTFITDELEGTLNLYTTTNNKELFGNADLHYGFNNFAIHSNYFNRSNKNYFDGTGNEVLNTDLKSNGYQFGFSFKPEFTLTGFSISNYKSEYGLPYFHIEDEDEGPIKLLMNKKDFRFLSEINKVNSFINTLTVKAGYQDYNHKEVKRETGETGTEFGIKSFSTDFSFNHKQIFETNSGIFGFWFMNQKYTVKGDEALTPDANYKSFATYFYESIKLNKINLQLGARYELNKLSIPKSELSGTEFEQFQKMYNSLSGSLGIAYNLTEHVSLYSNIANAFRAPTVEELASYSIHEATGSFDIGNRDLKVENNVGIEFGFKVTKQYHFVDLNFYFNSIDNYIFRNPTNIFYDPNNEVNKFNNSGIGYPVFNYNQSDAFMFGSELKAQYDFNNSITTILVMDYVRGYQKKPYENLPQIPPLRISIETRYSTDKNWIGFNWKIVSTQNKVANFENSTAGYGILDLYAGTKFLINKFVNIVDVKINNLFDQPYKDHLSSIKNFAYMPGRKVSLNYKFLF